jgi:hypothetical protein
MKPFHTTAEEQMDYNTQLNEMMISLQNEQINA